MRRALLVLTLVAGCPAVPATPQGIGLLRISELDGACAFETDGFGIPEIPDDLPFDRARAVASFQESTRWPGGHAITLGFEMDDGTVGRLQIEVPPERGYGIAFFPNPQWSQSVGFEQWKDGARTFAPSAVAGVLNYQPQMQAPPGFLGRAGEWSGPERPPEHLYLHVGFTGLDTSGHTVCRIVGMHSVTYRERQEPYDPTWLDVVPALAFVNEPTGITAPDYAAVSAPGHALVAPADAPPDPGLPPPWLVPHAPLALSRSSGDGSGACD